MPAVSLSMLLPHPQHLSCSTALFLSSDTLVTGHNNGDILVWNTVQQTVVKTLHAHQGCVSALCLMDGALVSGGRDRRLVMHDLNSWARSTRHKKFHHEITQLLPNGSTLLVAVRDEGVLVVDPGAQQLPRHPMSKSTGVTTMCFVEGFQDLIESSILRLIIN
jgi:hypothetical protein